MNSNLPPEQKTFILSHLNFIRNKKQEHLVCLSMSASNSVIRRRVVTVGLLDMVPVHPREVFAGAMSDRAAYIIIAHNHPSGVAQPSKFDIEVTQQLVAAGLLLGIRLKDHYIMTSKQHFSFADKGYV